MDNVIATCLTIGAIWFFLGLVLGALIVAWFTGRNYGRGYDDGFRQAQREEHAA